MFEFLFGHPARVFEKGSFVWLGSWPVWTLVALILIGGALLAWPVWRGRRDEAVKVRGWRAWVLWALQSSIVAALLAVLWQPAMMVATLKPQQNVVAVVIDDSKSMALADEAGGKTRSVAAREVLSNGLLASLQKQFQVRLYRFDRTLNRLDKVDQLNAQGVSTQLSENLKLVAAESASVPLGAIILLSDGADNAGGIDWPTLSEIRARRIPVHTVGLGRERFDKDLEISGAEIPQRALAESRVTAQVTLRHYGFSNQRVQVTIKDGSRVLAKQSVQIRSKDGAPQTETLFFNAGSAGPRAVDISVDPVEGEENQRNNRVTRLVNVESLKPRILYFEGEPKWEFKFIRRAMDEEKTVQLVTMLRTTQNKIYRQGVNDPKELEDGFPAQPEELFKYQGLIIGGIEIGYFTPTQQEMLRQFVDRRGGGLLFLGARNAISDGGWARSPLVDLLPVSISDRKDTFQRDRVPVELTSAGVDSLITRIEEDPARNAERWTKLPELANYQLTGAPKPGAVSLAEFKTPQGKQPLLVTQNYGRGRTALMATSGTWRWQMLQPLEDKSHELFWQQLCRWLVTDTPLQVAGSTPRQMLSDETRVELRAEVRDKAFQPVSDAAVEARILGPDGNAQFVELRPNPQSAGLYTSTWDAPLPGSYVSEIVAKRGEEEIGRDLFNFRREDGVAENFGAEQNKELLEKLSSQTGGVYYTAADAGRLAKEISFSEAGITVREAKDLWNMPAIFLTVLLLRATEWLLRRRWGVV
jgi:uncharacterized membrane protein